MRHKAISQACIGLAALLACIAMWPGAEAFERPKLWSVVACLLVSLTLVPRTSWKRALDWELKWPLIAYSLSFLIPCFIAGWTPRSVFGSEAVADGLLALGVGILFALLCRVALDDSPKKAAVLRWWLVGCTLTSLYALAQRFGFDPIPWGIQGEEGLSNLKFRVFSTLGNPSFLAMMLSMALPVGIWMPGPKRPIWICCSALCAIVLGLTMCRAGIIAGGFVVVVSGVASGRAKTSLAPAGSVAVALMLGIGVSGVGAPESTINRFAMLNSPTRASAGVRLGLAKAAAHAISAKPVFGWGNGGVPEALLRAGGDELPLKERLNPSAHNLILDAALERGALGLFSQIWLGFALAGAVRMPDRTGLNGAVGFSMLAYFINAFFGFATVGPWLSLCLLIGLVPGERASTPARTG